MIFDVVIPNLVNKLLPTRWRKPVHVQWLKAVVSATTWLKAQFDANRANDLYVVTHTGQVYSITGALNDALDPTLRRIYIADSAYSVPVYVYLADEDEPVFTALGSEVGSTLYASPSYLYTDAEVGAESYLFIVHVATAVSMEPGYSEARVRRIVDTYRLPSKGNYNVVLF